MNVTSRTPEMDEASKKGVSLALLEGTALFAAVRGTIFVWERR